MDRDSKITLENGHLLVEVLPQFGGNLYRIFHKGSCAEVLWHKERPSREGGFDDSWFGGLDVMFPCDMPYSGAGLQYPDHGSVWSKDMRRRLETKRHIVLSADCEVTGCEITIKIALRQSRVILFAEIYNKGKMKIPYLFRFHPAFLLDDGDRITLKPKMCHVDEISNVPAPGVSSFVWPRLPMEDGSTHCVNVVDSQFVKREIFHHYELSQNTFSVLRRQKGLDIDCEFSPSLACMTYYGALGTLHPENICVLEPASSIPADLGKAVENETVAYLRPREKVRYTLQIAVNPLV